jgi:sulfonate transport system substrate-binding protein
VDAWAVWDPYVSTAEDKFGARMLIPSTSIGTDNMTVMVARQAFVHDHPEAARAVFEALRDEDVWAATNPAEAAETWAKYVNQPLSIAKLLASHTGKKMVPIGPEQSAVLVRAAQFMVDHKIIPIMPAITDHLVDLGTGG